MASLKVRIPHSAAARGERTYAQLIRRISPDPGLAIIEGTWLKTGSHVEESQLWPASDYPLAPLLLEYAGSDRSGRGHARSRDLHILWRYDADAGAFIELARVLSCGAEWVYHLAPIIRTELGSVSRAPADRAERAAEAVTRVIDVLDGELRELEDEGRIAALARIYTQVSARLCASAHGQTGSSAHGQAPVYPRGGLDFLGGAHDRAGKLARGQGIERDRDLFVGVEANPDE